MEDNKAKRRADWVTMTIKGSDGREVTTDLQTLKAFKRQLEVPGTEREAIPELDALCARIVEATDVKDEVTEQLKELEIEAQQALASRDLDGYVYVDGERRFVLSRKITEKAKLEELRPDRKRKSEEA